MISIKAQDVAYELPMNPITMMRNALGKEEGGSGVPFDREKYAESVAFWREHAVLKEAPGLRSAPSASPRQPYDAKFLNALQVRAGERERWCTADGRLGVF